MEESYETERRGEEEKKRTEILQRKLILGPRVLFVEKLLIQTTKRTLIPPTIVKCRLIRQLTAVDVITIDCERHLTDVGFWYT